MYNVVPDTKPRPEHKGTKTKALLSFFLLSRLRMKIEIASKARNRARNTLRALRTRTWAALRYLVPRAGAGTPYSVQESGDGRRNQKPNGRVSIWFASAGPLVSTNKRSARGAQHRWLVRAGESRLYCRAVQSQRQPAQASINWPVLPAASTGDGAHLHQGSPFIFLSQSRAPDGGV